MPTIGPGAGSTGNIALALPLMFACILYGVPREKINTDLLRDLDWPGLAYAGLGFGLLYAGPRPGQPARLEQQRPGRSACCSPAAW